MKIPVYFYLFFGVIALGCSAILIRLADAEPLAIAAYRMGGGALLLLPFTRHNVMEIWGALSLKEKIIWAGSGIFLAFHFAFWIESLSHTSVASSVVLATTNPIFAGIGGVVLLGEKEGRNFWLGVLLAIVGSSVLAYSDFVGWEGSFWGNSLALSAAVMASAYMLCGRKLRMRIPVAAYVTGCYGFSGVLLFGTALILEQPLAGYSNDTWLLLLAMILIPTLIGHTSINYALGHLHPGKVALAVVGEPLVATALAWWLLQEVPTSSRLFACSIILMGIVLGGRSKS
ncbi:MAG: DMT family transporter [Nitrospinae bacterium]|nr:DMT family transporter [Nitrospinota bacterium]